MTGKYKHGEAVPSLDVAREDSRRAQRQPLDYLADNSPMAVKDTKILNRLEGIAAMPEQARDQVLHVIDALIFKAKFDGHMV